MNQNLSILTLIAIFSSFLIYFISPSEKKIVTSNLEGIVLTTLDGQKFELTNDLADKPILLVFWSTTCGSCIEEIPFISELHKSKRETINIVGVHPNFPANKIQKFVNKYKPEIPYLIAIDSSDSLSQKYQVSVLPRTILINNDGKVLYDHLGYSKENEKEIIDAIDNIK